MVKTNQINQVGSKKENQLEKVRLGLPIFKRTLFRVLGSVTFIVMTSIFTFAFLLIVILGNFVMMPQSFGATSTVLLTWVPFIIMAMYVMYFELHQISVVYNKEIKDGIINLEIRSGYSKTRIFAERFLANKVIICSWILVMLCLYAVIGAINPNLMPHEIAMNRVGSLSLIFIFDLFMTGILMLFASTSSSVFMGVLATIISLMYMAAPGISLAYAPDARYRNSNNQFTSEAKASKMEFMYKLQSIEEKYGGEGKTSIIKNNVNSLKDLKGYYSVDGDNDGKAKYTTEYQKTHGNDQDNNVTLEEYILVLMANGLLTEIENLNLYKVGDDTQEPSEIKIAEDQTNNYYLKTIEEIKRIDKNNGTKGPMTMEEVNNSMFRVYETNNTYDVIRSQDMFKGENGFFEFVDKLYKEVTSPEAKEIISLVEEAAIYLYDGMYVKNKHSSDKKGISILDWTFDTVNNGSKTQKYIWTYSTSGSQPEIDNAWSNKIEISDGARTFIKIYTDLIKNYASLDYRPSYGQEYIRSSQYRYIDANEYNNDFKVIGWLDPLTGFTRSFFEIGNSSYSLAENTSHYSSNVYDVISVNTSKKLLLDDEDPDATDEVEIKKRAARNTFEGLFGSTHDTEIVKLESNFNPQLYIVIFLLVDIAILGLGFLIFYKRIII